MDCKRIKILDGVLDVSLRVLFILSVYNKSMEKNVLLYTTMCHVIMIGRIISLRMLDFKNNQ